jgi:ATPase subunit of ABC transporter with duplicated ATPase domains
MDFEGTLIVVSHDRWFVSLLAPRVVVISPAGITDYLGTYDVSVHFSGDDHLDADAVVLKAKRDKKKDAPKTKDAGPSKRPAPAPGSGKERRRLEKERDELISALEVAERRVAEIEATFSRPGYYDKAPAEEVSGLDGERVALAQEIERSTEAWERVEQALEALPE